MDIFLCRVRGANIVVEFLLEFITVAECTLQVEKILSENFLYRPWHNRLVLSNEVRSYKKTLSGSCEECGFHEFLSDLREKEPNLAIKAEYDFNLPLKKFFTSTGDFSGCDVTNMIKAVEDSILGEVIDDKYVIESIVRKNPTLEDVYTIRASFNFFRYQLVRE
jgi:hypothetical protein